MFVNHDTNTDIEDVLKHSLFGIFEICSTLMTVNILLMLLLGFI